MIEEKTVIAKTGSKQRLDGDAVTVEPREGSRRKHPRQSPQGKGPEVGACLMLC